MDRGSWSDRGAHDAFVEAADAARTGNPCPDAIGRAGIGITETQEAGAANFGGSENRIEAENPIAAGNLEIGVDRKGLNLSVRAAAGGRREARDDGPAEDQGLLR